MDELNQLEDWVTPLLAKLSGPEQRALARTVARELRAGIRMSRKTGAPYTCPELQHRSAAHQPPSLVMGKRVDR